MGLFREGWHCDYKVFDFSEYPNISSSVTESATSESVYVRYSRNDIPFDKPQMEITVRYSLHESNATKFGEVLGPMATEDEVLSYLGYATRTFIPAFRPFIATEQIKYKNVKNYEQAELTIQEMYALGIGADLTPYVGKVAKGSNYLILGNTVEKFFEHRQNILGEWVSVGRYEYKRIPYSAK